MPATSSAAIVIDECGEGTAALDCNERRQEPRRRPAALRRLRCAWLVWHVAAALLTALAVYPVVSQQRRLALKKRWSRRLFDVIGIRHVVVGSVEPGALLVSNHISWLDIYVISAAHPAAFVAKREVRDWPLIGWLCEKTETIFIERGRARHARDVALTAAARLRAGATIAVFPEGTTTNGATLLPFHGALFEPAIAASAPVQALLIRYRDAHGRRSTAPSYAGDISFAQSLSAMLGERGLVAELVCLPPIAPATPGHGDRRTLARQCETLLAAENLRP